MDNKEFFRKPIQEVTFEELHTFFPDYHYVSKDYLPMPSDDGYPSSSTVYVDRFATYVQKMVDKWGEGDIVVSGYPANYLKSGFHYSIAFTNPKYDAVYSEHCKQIQDYYASKSPGDYCGD